MNSQVIVSGVPSRREKKNRDAWSQVSVASFRCRGLLEWSHAVINYFSFVTLIFSTIFAKVVHKIIFFFSFCKRATKTS